MYGLADKSPSSVDASTAYLMEGAMLAVGILLPQVLSKQQRFRDSLEPLATAYLLPLFSSPHAFLRAKAVWVAGQYASELEFSVPNSSSRQRGQGALFDQLFDVVLKCMNDSYVSNFLLCAPQWVSYRMQRSRTLSSQPMFAVFVD
jgi:hypothetical protein